MSYTYDAVGNRQSLSSTLNAIPAGLFHYDPNDRLTTDQYDANGNTTASAGITNTHDFENHLIQHGGITYQYDEDGNRVSKTIGGVKSTYLVDDQASPTGYAQVLEESQDGVLQTSYAYGPMRAFALYPGFNYNGGGVTPVRFYGYDGHGSVRFLTDETGAVVHTYDYDAFGNVINETDTPVAKDSQGHFITVPNNFMFAGEQYDPELGLYYNRARYLDVRIGRFWGMDTCPACITDPSSLHAYLYSHADPVNFVDPSGNVEFSLLGSTFTLSINDTIDAARTKAEQYLGQRARRGVVCETGKILVEQALVMGVYIILTDLGEGTVVPYVGASGDISARIGDHIRNGKMFERVFYFFEVAGGLQARRLVEQKVIMALTEGIGLLPGVKTLPDAERIIANLRNEIRLDKFLNVCK